MDNLQDILKEHAEWIATDGEAGKRADLRDADLRDTNLRCADLRRADLSGAELGGANLRGAKLRSADLCGAHLNFADLCHADLRDANLCGVKLRGAELRGAELRGAELNGAILDFSCWPLWCGSLGAIADDRLVAQLLFHVTRLDVSKCSGEVQEAVEHIRRMAVADLFCEYRDDVEPLDN